MLPKHDFTVTWWSKAWLGSRSSIGLHTTVALGVSFLCVSIVFPFRSVLTVVMGDHAGAAPAGSRGCASTAAARQRVAQRESELGTLGGRGLLR